MRLRVTLLICSAALLSALCGCGLTSSNTPLSRSVNGSGHSVTLRWDPSTSTVKGYNIYRALATGGPFTLLSSMDVNTSFTDSVVQAGQTYFYAVTSVSSDDTESGFSNVTSVTIP